MDKKLMSETDIRTKYITPAITDACWSQNQIREEVSFTAWRIKVKGKTVSRWEPKRADYILYYNNHTPIAIVEAKDNKHAIWDGMQQALQYWEILDIPFIYTSNWDWFLEHDRTKWEWEVEKLLRLDEFPTPEELYRRYKVWKWIADEEEIILNQPNYDDWSGKKPRYYQQIAINRTVEAIVKGQNRILLVMATGTWKTFTAFQIIHKLWKAWVKKRILFLADRNILIDQTMVQDFAPFGWAMTKITHRKIDKSYEIYLALYQWVSGTEDFDNVYKEFSPDFFDLIIVDECHRWSAKENSAWREILKYFNSATQIWLTATPKETNDISTTTYFWKPVYTYSLNQGIEDGYLAPYKVIKVQLNVDDEWRPYKGQVDFFGNEIPDEIYNVRDYDRRIVIRERTEEVAKRITEYLKECWDRYAKTIVFCVDIEHAERMRQALVNCNADEVKKNHKYVMKITGDDKEWKAELDSFISPKERYPVIVTTSKLLTTWVDAKTCKLIVLDSNINSATEFMQIIGRWTRIREDYGKYFFTIMDFRKATNMFADEEFIRTWFWLDPIVVINIDPKEPVKEPDEIVDGWEPEVDTPEVVHPTVIIWWDWNGDKDSNKQKKILVCWVPVSIINERVQYIGADGKLINESIKDYSKKNILGEYKTLDEFINAWEDSDKKQAIIDELEDKGVLLEELQSQLWEDMDPFDLICHVAFDKPALTRKERANNVKKRDVFTKYWEKAREVISLLLDKYADNGIEAIEDINVLKVDPFNTIWTPLEIIKNIFWWKNIYLEMVKELEKSIYETR